MQGDHFFKIKNLVYTDIGMNALATQLAGLRLAPVQCKGWGHPVTTGLPTMDYYLSSELMEPENGRNHYSEILVRLPQLALAYKPPILPPQPRKRESFGIRPEAFVYLTTQSLFKYLPQFDYIFPRIAGEVPHAQFVFISHSTSAVTEQFQRRLDRAFAAFNLDSDKFCLYLPRLNFPDFLSLNLAGNALLDSLHWSGGKTTLEGVWSGLPVVTCPGNFMRGRHSYAMLTMMGIDSTIAADESNYIQIAVRLGMDDNWYAAQKKLIADNKGKLFNDRSCIRGLENFYRGVVRNSVPDPAIAKVADPT